MSGREALGAAAVSDDELAAIVARSHGTEVPGTLLDVDVTEVPYGLDAISTAGRHRVRGTARYADGDRPFSLFVKQVQSWERSAIFQQVPEEIRELAATGFPWRIEPLVYRSDLAARLPDGLRMPRSFGVFELDELSASIWLEDVPIRAVTWDLPRYERAAHLLGRMAGSPEVAVRAGVGEFDWNVGAYIGGRLTHQVFPMLRVDELWEHPLIAGSFDAALRGRLLAIAENIWDYGHELMALPTANAHGDACPNNLLVRPDDETSFTLIDFGFWMELPVGFDLGQLLVGDVQIGARSSDDLAERDEACLVAYHHGLAAEGYAIDLAVLRRAHAVHLLLFTGVSAFPWDLVHGPLTPEVQAIAASRAAITRYVLDLVEATS
ncbi:phosphotransferase [Nocardioides marmorisolisilvae]|nr:phosphotransferase [Nocardioides marmorisolisilvae]